MASENNVRPQSANAVRDKSKGKNKISETRGYTSSPLAGTQSRRLFPSTQSTNVMSDSIKSFYPDAWSLWREIPVFARDQMWNDFRECVWKRKHDYQIFCNFEKQAADMLYDMLWTAWQNDQKPDWMLEGIWARLYEKWTTEFQKRSIQAKAPRASNKGGLLHIGSTANIGTRRRKLEKRKGRTMTYDDVFEEKRVKNKKDGHRTLVEPHVERTNVGHKKSLDEWRQSQATSEDDSSTQSSDDDEASIIPETIGGVKKGKSRGVGSHNCLGCEEEIDSLRRQVQELSKKQKAGRMRFNLLEDLLYNLMEFCRPDQSDYDSDSEN